VESELIGRILFGLCLMLSWWISMTHIIHNTEMLYTRSVRGRLFFDRRVVAFLPLTVLFGVAVVGFVLQWMEVFSAIIVVLAIVGIRRWEISRWKDNIVVDLGKYAPSASCLVAYLCGYGVALWLGSPPEAMGTEVACGALGAAWFLTGWKKLQLSGVRWMSTESMGLLMAERAYIGTPPLRALRRAVIRSRSLLLVIGFLGLVLELGGLAFCMPSLRMAYALTIEGLLIGVAILLGYVEPEWMGIILALALMS